MISFLVARQSDPAAMPVAEPESDDPWLLTWHESSRRWLISFLDDTEDETPEGHDGLDSLLAFVAYLGCPVQITGNGRSGAPEIVILDVRVPR